MGGGIIKGRGAGEKNFDLKNPISVNLMNVDKKNRFLTYHTLQFIKIDILPVFILLIAIE